MENTPRSGNHDRFTPARALLLDHLLDHRVRRRHADLGCDILVELSRPPATLAHVYFEDEPGRFCQAALLSAGMSALPPKADIGHFARHVRFVPKADNNRSFNHFGAQEYAVSPA
jgi:hypothetical protein